MAIEIAVLKSVNAHPCVMIGLKHFVSKRMKREKLEVCKTDISTFTNLRMSCELVRWIQHLDQ